jgi:ATP-dependent protease ClpP protease subunit
LIVPHPDYRLNPFRAIYVSGVISADLVSKLTPQILKHHTRDRNPITVYIDSPGGQVISMEAILRLLKLSNQDGSSPCRIITAVTTHAASAAADMLASGDYAVAYPTSTILYHGLRRWETNPLTQESTSVLASTLRRSNDIYAMQLARKIEDRFSFRFMTSRGEFAAIRAKQGKADLSDVECFIELIEGKLSSDAKKVLDKAKHRRTRYVALFTSVLKKIERRLDRMTPAELEVAAIREIAHYELKNNKNTPNWMLSRGGLDQLTNDFFLLNEYLSSSSGERLKKWSASFGRWILPDVEAQEVDAIQDLAQRNEKILEKVRPLLYPLSTFFIALCHALQEGENELTATDAYWLGLVDEVIGENLWTVRYFEEFHPDAAAPEANEETQTKAEEPSAAEPIPEPAGAKA